MCRSSGVSHGLNIHHIPHTVCHVQNVYIAPRTAVAAEAAAAANVCAIYRMCIAQEKITRTNEYEYMKCIEETTDVVMALAAQVRHDPLDSPRVHPTNASDQVAQPYALNTTSYNGPAYQHWIVTVVGRVSACIAVAHRRMGAQLGTA